jgi:hypothetical protein
VFIISHPDAGPIFIRSVELIEAAVQSSQPGRYQIDRLHVDPLTSDRTSRRWGIGIKHDDGSIVIEPEPWHP